MSKPKTKKLFPIHRHESKWHNQENAFERKSELETVFRWDDAADTINDILEKAYYTEILPDLLKKRDPKYLFTYKADNQCLICYMKTLCNDGPLPELGRCDFCPGGLVEESVDDK